jgi:branched-subunit amino acid transport protein AzlD
MIDTRHALLYTAILGAVIFLCRLLPFILFRPSRGLSEDGRAARRSEALARTLRFVEKITPPAAITALTVGALVSPVALSLREGLGAHGALRTAWPLLAASALCAALHILKRNVLLSVFIAVAAYMLFIRIS